MLKYSMSRSRMWLVSDSLTIPDVSGVAFWWDRCCIFLLLGVTPSFWYYRRTLSSLLYMKLATQIRIMVLTAIAMLCSRVSVLSSFRSGASDGH